MEFEWDDETRRYLDQVARFAVDELDDDVVARDAAQSFWREGWERCAAFGIQGLPLPARYGGRDADQLTVMGALEELGYACRDNGLLFSINAHMWGCEIPVLRFGTDKQRETYLPGLVDGTLIGALAMTEPGSGSDAYRLSTVAVPDAGGYTLNGHKVHITNAPVADVFVVVAASAPGGSFTNLSAFLVDRDTPGLTVGPAVSKMGLRTAGMAEVHLTDARVGTDRMLGEPGAGMAVFNAAMEWERACILAGAVGTMRHLLERCTAFARERTRFGRPIGDFQAVAHKLVDMRLRLETSRLLLHQLGWRHGRSRQVPAEAAMAKLHVSESLVQSSLDALHVHGAYGYLSEAGLERQVRDALASRTYSGTSEMQRDVIARGLGL